MASGLGSYTIWIISNTISSMLEIYNVLIYDFAYRCTIVIGGVS